MIRVYLLIDGIQYYGWKSVAVTRSLDAACSTFNLTTTDRAFGDTDIRAGQKCQIFYGDDLILTGIIDNFQIKYDANNHEISVNGRSVTKDLVDCSVQSFGEFAANLSPIDIAKKLVAPYGVNVVTKNLTNIKPYKGKFSIESNGEMVYEALHRLAEIQQFTVTDDENGNLLLARYDENSEDSGNQLQHYNDGQRWYVNVLSGSYEEKEEDSYSKITVRGQSKGSDTNFGKNVAGVSASVTNPNVTRTRELTIQAQSEATLEEMQNLANFESERRNGQRETWNYTVQGWKDISLWKVGTLVAVRDDYIYPNPDSPKLLVSEIKHTIDDGGTKTELSLSNIAAFSYKPITEKIATVNKSAGRSLKAKKSSTGKTGQFSINIDDKINL